MSEKEAERLRNIIRRNLRSLMEDLGDIGQTTHPAFDRSDIKLICGLMPECYRDPSHFNVSELSQQIRYFLKREEKP